MDDAAEIVKRSNTTNCKSAGESLQGFVSLCRLQAKIVRDFLVGVFGEKPLPGQLLGADAQPVQAILDECACYLAIGGVCL